MNALFASTLLKYKKLFIGCFIFGCISTAYADLVPIINSINPSQASIGSEVTVTGRNFSNQSLNYLRFGKALIGPFQSVDGVTVTFVVPENALGGCHAPSFKPMTCMAILTQKTMPGNYTVVVVTPGGESNSGSLEIR